MLPAADIEYELQKRLEADGYNASATPLPRDYGSRLPFVLVSRTGGDRKTLVIDRHRVSVDVFGKRWASATEAADELAGHIASMAGSYIGDVWCCDSAVATLPYNNPDPSNQDWPRVTFLVELTVKATEKG